MHKGVAMTELDEWLTIEEAAERLKVSRRMVYRYMDAGQLQYYQVGDSGHRRIKRSDLDALMRPGTKTTAQGIP